MVSRSEFERCLEIRRKVCAVYADIEMHEAGLNNLPEQGVPQPFLDHALSMSETANLKTTMEGPASRQCVEADDVDASIQGEDVEDAEPTVEQEQHVVEEQQDMIGLDYASDPPAVQLFNSMQTKYKLLTKEAKKAAFAASTPDAPTAAGVGAKEHCRRLLVDLQDVARKLSSETKADMENLLVPNQAIAMVHGKALSAYDATSYPSAFVEWFYGDAAPFAERPIPLTCQQVFSCLLNREELQYDLPTDQMPFEVGQNRFDSPTMVCFMGDTVRRMRTISSIKAAFERPGFEKDMDLISALTAKDFVQSANSSDNGAHMTDAKLRAHKALQHLQFSTALVPMTDGYKMRLKHVGASFTRTWGPLQCFCTANHADTWSPIFLGIATSQAVAANYDGCGRLNAVHRPEMPTLSKMHQLSCNSPRATMRFFCYKKNYRIVICFALIEYIAVICN